MDTKELFERIIAKWRRRTSPVESLTLTQIANIALGKGDSKNAALVGRTLSEFSPYFRKPHPNGHKFEVNWASIQRDYPDLMDKKPAWATEKERDPGSAIDDMTRALDNEIRAVRAEMEERPTKCLAAYLLTSEADGSFLYEGLIELAGEGELPIPEGVGIRLIWPSFLDFPHIDSTLLSYDALRSTIIFDLERPLTKRQLSTEFRIYPRVDELLKIVKAKLSSLSSAPEALSRRLLSERFQPESVAWPHPVLNQGLDDSQEQAVRKCLNQDITFVWGPPGTGKTHALARLILNAAMAGQKVVATAIANVAVDQLALRVVQAFEEMGPKGCAMLNRGGVFRFGHPRLSEVSGESRLFPRQDEIQEIRKQLHEARKAHRAIPPHDSHARALSQRKINALSDKLRHLMKLVFDEARVILTTAVQVCLESAFAESTFNLMVVDEASMMSVPYLMCMGLHGRERFVVAGDFRQLGPIALSKSQAAYQWLHISGFDLIGVSQNLHHPALAMLTIQRRMHEGICELINQTFYDGKLITRATKETTRATSFAPIPATPSVFVKLLPQDGSEIEQTESHSRRNRRSAEEVVKIAAFFVNTDPTISVGIISPYRAQVALIKKLRDGSLPQSAADLIKVGTVHAFQGSESDIIIWDLVETRGHRIGKLYRDVDGDRLVNVAISRAKGKLVIVGDREAFFEAPASDAVKRFRFILTRHFPDRSPSLVKAGDLDMMA